MNRRRFLSFLGIGVMAAPLAAVAKTGGSGPPLIPAAPDIDWSEGMTPGQVNNSARAMMAICDRLREET